MPLHITFFSFDDLVNFIDALGKSEGYGRFSVYQFPHKPINVYELEINQKVE